MNRTSRRALARYAADQLLESAQPKRLAKELAAIMVSSGRASELQFLLSDIEWELENRQMLAIGRVTTAVPLSESLGSALKAQVKKATEAREVLLEKNIDKSMLGGLRIETSKSVWDLSVKSSLARLREVF